MAETFATETKEHVKSIRVCEAKGGAANKKIESVNPSNPDLVFCFYLYRIAESLEDGEKFDKGNGDPALFTQLVLPRRDIEGVRGMRLIQSLVFSTPLKESLLDYMKTALLFSDAGVDQQLVGTPSAAAAHLGINRVCLLYGPPGTGKTTLCKALAQKITIRLKKRYKRGILVEIHSHSIFSKFFAESAKMLLKMFQELHLLLDDADCFVCLLMDEVESLTAARKASMNGSEPSDSIRVVNCLLTQIDLLKSRGNVLVMCTSNITEAIDVAFIDRADIKQFVGHPSLGACYTILRTGLLELMRANLIRPEENISKWENAGVDAIGPFSGPLVAISKLAQGLSGRTLCKLVFLAHCKHIAKPVATLSEYLDALLVLVKDMVGSTHHQDPLETSRGLDLAQ
ncbi:Pachytene checkpoint protein 2 [Kappamyces sp. JEL0829]|nr:Pachytene checkpoint protein 2 [Kappamyces sp. JEL0829]